MLYATSKRIAFKESEENCFRLIIKYLPKKKIVINGINLFKAFGKLWIAGVYFGYPFAVDGNS